MALIPGLNPLKRKPGYERETTPPEGFPPGLAIEEKLERMAQDKRTEDYAEDIARRRLYYAMELMYRGYHDLWGWDETKATWQYDADADRLEYHENQLRKDVITVQGMLIRGEPVPVIRPGGPEFDDMEAAKTGEAAWEVIQDNIDQPQIIADKSLFKCLYGNAFIYSGYMVDPRWGRTRVARFTYDHVELPGAALCMACGVTSAEGTRDCPECGRPMVPMPPETMETRRADGFDERPKGQEFSMVCSPLEVKIRSRVRGGVRFWPYVRWHTREDVDILRRMYPDLKITGTASGISSYQEHRYIEHLAHLPGNIGDTGHATYYSGMHTANYREADVERLWLRPEMFRGDTDLERTYPDGVAAVLVDGQCVDHRKEKIEDCWTHEILYRNPHSAYGDGMFDCIPVNRYINLIKRLMARHVDYSSVGLTAYDDTMFDPIVVSNDPAERFVAVKRAFEGRLADGFHTISPAQLAPEIPMLLQMSYQAMQDMSGAFNPSAGKEIGANTPYSAYVMLDERAQGRFLPAAHQNAGQVKEHTRQLLTIAQKEWIDPRQKIEIDQNTGRMSWKIFTGADLARGSWDVKVSIADFKPKTRAEQMQGFEFLRNFNIDPTASPKGRIFFFETVGMPIEDNISVQVRRTYRQIERMKQGETVAPLPEVDDPIIQMPALIEFMASPGGEDLGETHPEAFSAVYLYFWSLKMMLAQSMAMDPTKMAAPPPGPAPGGPPPEPGKSPGGQEGQPGGGPAGAGQEYAQSPAANGRKPVMPPLPAGAR